MTLRMGSIVAPPSEPDTRYLFEVSAPADAGLLADEANKGTLWGAAISGATASVRNDGILEVVVPVEHGRVLDGCLPPSASGVVLIQVSQAGREDEGYR